MGSVGAQIGQQYIPRVMPKIGDLITMIASSESCVRDFDKKQGIVLGWTGVNLNVKMKTSSVSTIDVSFEIRPGLWDFKLNEWDD